MVSYVKKKQYKILTEDEVTSIVEQIESNRFSKSWRTNRQHKAYLKDKHSNPNKNIDNPTPEPIVKETVKRPILKSREVQRWSGQTEIESSELPIDSLNTQHASTPYDMANKVFLTPFVIETPTCPKCNGEMVERTAKKGARQGQSFYGCAQFPKCRGVVNGS